MTNHPRVGNMNKLVYAGALLSLLASQGAAQKLTGFATSKSGDNVEVRVLGENLKQPRLFKFGPEKYVVEFDGKLEGQSRNEKVNFGAVRSVSLSALQTNPPKARLAVSVHPDSFVSLGGDEGKWYVTVSNTVVAAITRPSSQGATGSAERVYSGGLATVVAQPSKPVSLDFVNTDVVQILKALALQSGVNIVTAPEVKGALTVSLKNVSVVEALDLVTTLAGVRYAKVGKTYVVSSNDRFGDTMRQIGGTVQDTSETRVVPIYSGEGKQVKAAVLKSVARGSASVEIVLPSEELSFQQKDVVSAPDGDPAASTATGETVMDTRTAAQSGKVTKPDAYVVLIGPAQRLDDYERAVKAIDEQICRAVGVEVPSTSTMVRKLYRPKGSTAATLLQAVTGEKPTAGAGVYKAKVGSVDLFATPTGSISDQVIVLYGRETEVNQLISNMENIDAVGETRGDYLIYEVRHLDPRALREELLVQVPGLTVSIPSNAASNPNLYKGGAITGESSQKVGTSGAEATSGDAPSRESQVNLTADTGQNQGLTLPFRDAEKVAVPMKLILRGSKDQIQRALGYLEVVDVAPKQIALELRVMDISREDALRVGLDWSILTGGTVQAFRVNNGIESSSSLPGTVSSALGFAGGGSLNVLATLDQLATNRNLIARPNLIATDGRETEIFVGDVVRYVESIQATQNGVTVETGEVPVGVRLAVLPRIGGNGQLTLELRPAVTTLNGFTPVPGGGSLPQTGLRIAQSTMTIRSGETIALGGLIQDSDRKSESGVPILKDLPIIGMLFKRTETRRQRSEIVFFLTAREVGESNRQSAADPRESAKNSPSDQVGK